jgi:hypothetical protein
MAEDTHQQSDDQGRRDFLKGTLIAGAAVTASTVTPPAVQAQPGMVPGTRNHYYVPANDKTRALGILQQTAEAARRGELR